MYGISKDLLQAILDFLGKQQHNDVYKIHAAILQCKPIVEVKKEKSAKNE